MSRVTIAEVASAAGVSKTAVSFAFNSPERLGQATLERVLGVAQDLGYTPHPAARALSMRRSGTIGVLIPQRLSTVFANPFLGELIQGLGELCEEHDLTLLLVPPLNGSLEGAIRQASVDGFISLGLSPDDSALAVLDRIGIPTVLIDSEGSPAHPAVNVAAKTTSRIARFRFINASIFCAASITVIKQMKPSKRKLDVDQITAISASQSADRRDCPTLPTPRSNYGDCCIRAGTGQKDRPKRACRPDSR